MPRNSRSVAYQPFLLKAQYASRIIRVRSLTFYQGSYLYYWKKQNPLEAEDIMNFLKESKDAGLLILRLGIGAMFILHGLPKMLDGPTGWEKLAQFGLPFLPEGILSIAFGLTAALSELVGGLLLMAGVFHRIACMALMGTMAVAFSTKLSDVTGLTDFAVKAGWPLELLIVFTALFFAGPGRFRLKRT
jgi:putative oxidoreductase